jgi:hypothetical protein
MQAVIGEKIEGLASRGIFVDIVCDAYKFDYEGQNMYCFRACVTWKEDGVWKEDDAGCFKNWERAVEEGIKLGTLKIKDEVLKTGKLK